MSQNTKKADVLRSQLFDLFKKELATAEEQYNEQEVELTYTNEYELNTFLELKERGKKIRGKQFKVLEVEAIQFDPTDSSIEDAQLGAVTKYAVALGLKKENKKELFVSDKMGFYKVSFSDGSFLFFVKWLVGEGKDRCVDGLFLAKKQTWVNLFNALKQEKKRLSRPKKGLYRIRMNSGQLSYEKVKELNETPVFHPSTAGLLKDIEFFYDNVALFTKRNQPGTRKVILIGPPGTGKTSISMRLASRYMKEKCVAFATDLSSVASHLHKCAHHNVSTLVVLEDAESSLKDVDSSILNFLDGIDQPINKKGAYVIMTTNHPDRIEPRAVRVGRVAKRIMFGTLKGQDALTCAKMYFEDILWTKDTPEKEQEKIFAELLPIVSNDDKGMTGAEIKGLSEAVVAYAVSEVIDKITPEIVEQVKEDMTNQIKDLVKMAEEEGLTKSSSGRFGFNSGKKAKKKEFEYNPEEELDRF